jgi:hypothetical protein
MMAATPTKLRSEAGAGRSEAQHALILGFYSRIASVTHWASTNAALSSHIGAGRGLNSTIFANSMTEGVPNGECWFKSYEDIVDLCCEAWNRLINRPWKIMSIGCRQWAKGF